MFKVPVTYIISSLVTPNDRARNIVMNEFAAQGEKHIVLSDGLIRQCIQDFNFVKQLKKEMEENGLTFLDSHAPFGPYYDLNSPYEELRPRMIQYQLLTLEIAADFDVKTITFHVGNNHYDDTKNIPIATHIDKIKSALDVLLPHAERLGLTIGIENIWTGCNTADALLKVKEAFPTDALGFCYDSGHANITLKDRGTEENYAFITWKYTYGNTDVVWQPDLLEKMLPHIVNCHLHDNDGIKDTHLPPGMGNIDWSHVIPLLNSAPRLRNIQSESEIISVSDICKRFRGLEEKYT